MKPRVKTILKIVGGLVAALVLLIAIGVGVLFAFFPKSAPPATATVTATPELLARGDYLYNHGCACVACHSQRDWSLRDGPVKPGTSGQGGDAFGAEHGVPGTIYARNITPAGLKDWSDGEIARAIHSGIAKDGTALFPLMPYQHYERLAQTDIDALVVYLRSLPAIAHAVPERKLAFPMNLIVRTIPHPAVPPAAVPKTDDPAYGAYVVNAAGCLHCHSPSRHGAIEPGREFTGGVAFPLPYVGTVRSANLTPDELTGLGKWTKGIFVARFRAGVENAKIPAKSNDFTSPMPWSDYGGMTDQDLEAAYGYLRSLKPVANVVVKFSPE